MPTVKVQRMFPNCQKYKKCCKKVSNYEEMTQDMLEESKKNVKT